MGTSSQAYEAGYLNLSYLSSPEPFGRYDSDAPLSDEISELDLNAPPSDAADFSAIQDHSPVPDYVDTADIEPYDAGIEPYDYANFGTSTYSRTELRTQLDTLARQLGFPSVGSSTAAWEIVASNWHANHFALYFTVLAMFLKKGGTVVCVRLPLLLSHTSNSSSQIPLSPNASRRGHCEVGVDRGGETKNTRRKLSPVKSADSSPETPSTPDNSTRNPLSVGGSPLPVVRRVIQFGDAVSVSYSFPRGKFGHCKHSRHSPRSVTTERDTVPALYSRPPTHNVSYHSTPPTPLTPATPVIAANSGGHTILSRSTCFTTSRLDQGIRIRIVPETIDDTTETWIDITGVQFRPKMKRAIPGYIGSSNLTKWWFKKTFLNCLKDVKTPAKHLYRVKVIGFADWLCLEDEWMSAYYRKVLVTESIRKFENDQRNEFHAKTLNQEVFARKQVCDLKDGSKPKHKELLYPSGDDLGINWSASQAENLKVRLSMIMRRSLDPGSQAEERNNTWLWYVWKQYGLTRGWVEPSREFGDKVRNPKDSSSLTEIMVKTTKQVNCMLRVGFLDMERSLAGETIEEFKNMWKFRHRRCGGPCWEV